MNHEQFKPVCKRYCSYVGCSSDSINTNGGAISFFGFPKDTERCSKWITNSGREEFRYLTPRELNGKKICELHFHPSMFSNKFRTHLKKSAFPMNWKNTVPELIEIEDDDDNDELLSLGEDNEEITNGSDVQELSDGGENNGQIVLNNTLLNSVTNNQLMGNSNNEALANNAQEPISADVLLNRINFEPADEIQPVSAVTSSTTVKETPTNSTEKISSTSNQTSSNKTKFHNLPSQTTQGEFYYQCPSVEETNQSYPEPQEGEMPLFVQQSSAMSMAEETANSEATEPPSKRWKRDKEADISAEMKEAMKYLKDITELLTTSEDEFELFGKSVTLQLKKMNLCTAIAAQAKIQQVLSQFRIHDIKKKTQKDLDDITNVNGFEGNKCDEENMEKQSSLPLSLDCVSEKSNTEVDNEES